MIRKLIHRIRWSLFTDEERYLIGFGLYVIDNSGGTLDDLREETGEFIWR